MTATNEKLAELAEILGCKANFVLARLDAIGLSVTCSRCGGCGNYSYCQMHGTTCFDCNGTGRGMPKLSAGLVAAAREAVAAGKLQPYLDRVAMRSRARKAVNQAMDAWRKSRVGIAYNAQWREVVEKNPGLYAANHAMCVLYDEASTLGRRLEHGDWSNEKREYVRLDGEELERVCARLVAIPDEIRALDYDA